MARVWSVSEKREGGHNLRDEIHISGDERQEREAEENHSGEHRGVY